MYCISRFQWFDLVDLDACGLQEICLVRVFLNLRLEALLRHEVE